MNKKLNKVIALGEMIISNQKRLSSMPHAEICAVVGKDAFQQEEIDRLESEKVELLSTIGRLKEDLDKANSHLELVRANALKLQTDLHKSDSVIRGIREKIK